MNVDVGQWWKSSDPREKLSKEFQIVQIDEAYALCESRGENRRGYRRLVRRRIRLDRFRPGSRGYVFVRRSG